LAGTRNKNRKRCSLKWQRGRGTRAATEAAFRMTLTIVGNAVKTILSNETKVQAKASE